MQLYQIMTILPEAEGELRDDARAWARKHEDDLDAALVDPAYPHCRLSLYTLLGGDGKEISRIVRELVLMGNDMDGADTEYVGPITADAQRYVDGEKLELALVHLERLGDRAFQRQMELELNNQADAVELAVRIARDGGGQAELARAMHRATRIAKGIEMAGYLAKLVAVTANAKERRFRPWEWRDVAAHNAGLACQILIRSLALDMAARRPGSQPDDFAEQASAAVSEKLNELLPAHEIRHVWSREFEEVLDWPDTRRGRFDRPKAEEERSAATNRIRRFFARYDDAPTLDHAWFDRVQYQPGEEELEVALRVWDAPMSAAYLLVMAPQVGISRRSCFRVAHKLLADIWAQPSRAPTQTKQTAAARMLDSMRNLGLGAGTSQEAMEKLMRSDLSDEQHPRPATLVPDDVRRKVDALRDPLNRIDEAFARLSEALDRDDAKLTDHRHLAEFSDGLMEAGNAVAHWCTEDGRGFFMLNMPKNPQQIEEDAGGFFDTAAVRYIAQGLCRLLDSLAAESDEDFADMVSDAANAASEAMAYHRILDQSDFPVAIRQAYDESEEVLRQIIPREEVVAALREFVKEE